jgi:hypothetical protein
MTDGVLHTPTLQTQGVNQVAAEVPEERGPRPTKASVQLLRAAGIAREVDQGIRLGVWVVDARGSEHGYLQSRELRIPPTEPGGRIDDDGTLEQSGRIPGEVGHQGQGLRSRTNNKQIDIGHGRSRCRV